MLRYNFPCYATWKPWPPALPWPPPSALGRSHSQSLVPTLSSPGSRLNKKWFKIGLKLCSARKFLKSNVSHFFDRRLEFSWLASLSTHPLCQHQCGTWRDVDFLAEQIKNAFQRTTIVCSIYSSTKSAYFACNYRACWIFIFTFCEVLFVDCQIWYLETFSLIWSKRNMHQEKMTSNPTVFLSKIYEYQFAQIQSNHLLSFEKSSTARSFGARHVVRATARLRFIWTWCYWYYIYIIYIII